MQILRWQDEYALIFERRFLLLLICFFLSGFAGLVYQTAWLLELSLVFGTSELALVTVLAAYMAGLASGAALVSRFIYRIRHTLAAYALLELGIALAALAVPYAIDGAAALHGVWFGGGALTPNGETWVSGLYYLGSSFLILWIPTAFMGATLPLLAHWAIHDETEIGSKMGLLYSFNTGGAALGTAMAAFLLLPHLGLGLTVWVAVGTNVLVFILAWLLGRGTSKASVEVASSEEGPVPSLQKGHWILPVIFVSGMVSFTWEVLWTRLLSHLLGSSVYAFSTMLATFLIGLALGSGLVSRAGKTIRQASRNFVLAQLAIAFCSITAFVLVDRMAVFAQAANQQNSLVRGALIVNILLMPSALAIGATFPLAVRLYTQHAVQAGLASSRIFAWNTLGAILGVLTTGYWVLPHFKFAGTALLATVVSLLLAGVAGLMTRPRKPAFVGFALAGVLLLGLFPPKTPWQVLQFSPFLGKTKAASNRVAYYGVGRSATVLLTEEPNYWRLTTDGLPESAIERVWGRPNRYVVARWLSLLPLAARPQTKSMLVIGFGAGITIEKIPESVTDIHVVELEPEVIRANQAIHDRPNQPLDDPRVQVQLNDARGALRLSQQKFDAIVSQPSHPWTSGAANLFTLEFFVSVKEHLSPNGVFVQWMGLAFIDGPLLKTLVATANQAFDYVEVYRPVPGVVLILSSQKPLNVLKTMSESLAQAGSYWNEMGVFTEEDVWTARALTAQGSKLFSKNVRVSTDHRNLFRYGSPGALHNPILAQGAQKLLAPFEPLSDQKDDGKTLYFIRRLLFQGEVVRAEKLAETLSSEEARLTARSLCHLASGRPKQAEALLKLALKSNATYAEARAAYLQRLRPSLSRGQAVPHVLRPLGNIEQKVIDGWRLLQLGDWQGVGAMDPTFASLDVLHPMRHEVTRLRVRWRIQSDVPKHGFEAVELLDPLLVPIARSGDLLLRARASLIWGKPRMALSSLQEALSLPSPKYQQEVTAQRAVSLLKLVPDSPETNTWRQQLLSLTKQKLSSHQRVAE